MDASQFDRVTRSLATEADRRGFVRRVAALWLAGSVAVFAGNGDSEAGRGRHKHAHLHLQTQESDRRGKRKDRRQEDRRDQHRERRQDRRQDRRQPDQDAGAEPVVTSPPLPDPTCIPDSLALTCNRQCGAVSNNCGTTVDCGACDCDPTCGVCFSCDPSTGQCQPDPDQGEALCGADDACTHELCQADGTCSRQDKTDGTICDDGDSCTATDRCANGECRGERISGGGCCLRAEDCPTSPSPCLVPICRDNGRCDVRIAIGETCDDGDPCTTNGICRIDLGGLRCAGTTVPNCRSCVTPENCPTPSSPCQIAVCAADHTCAVANVASGSACNDGDPCTSGGVCNAAGVCTATPIDGCVRCSTAVDCPEENRQCYRAVCTSNGTCDVEIRRGDFCDDGNACTEVASCNANGNCEAISTETDCVPCSSSLSCNDGHDCTQDLCVNGRCQHSIFSDQCLIDGVCYAPGGHSGYQNPANSCQTCQPGTSQTTWTALADHTSCGGGAGVCHCGQCQTTCAALGEPCSQGCECCLPGDADVVCRLGPGCCIPPAEKCQNDTDCCDGFCGVTANGEHRCMSSVCGASLAQGKKKRRRGNRGQQRRVTKHAC